MFAIIVHEKGGAERREIFDAAELSVGRVQGNELMLPKGNVSKRHARLLYRDGRFIVTDLNSTNGTYVNRHKITQATIVREGDRIYIGDFVLRIETSGADGLSPDEFKTGPSAVARSSPNAPDVSNVTARPDANASYATKYFASGWGTMMAEVDCSGTRWNSSVIATPMRSISSSSATFT